MQQINHENNLMGAAASTAKSNYKKLSRYRLFFAMAAACFVAPTAFLIYFIVNFSAVGIWAFAITSLLAAAAAAAVLIITVPRYKTASESIKQFLLGGGEKKKTPPSGRVLYGICKTCLYRHGGAARLFCSHRYNGVLQHDFFGRDNVHGAVPGRVLGHEYGRFRLFRVYNRLRTYGGNVRVAAADNKGDRQAGSMTLHAE